MPALAIALALDEAGLIARSVFTTMVVCTSRRIGIYFSADRPIASVAISHWAGPEAVLKNATAYRVPLYDRKIGNDERIRITYR